MERFTKVRPIGKGCVGSCTLVRINSDGRNVVLKQVDLSRLDKEERQRAENEIRVLQKLQHPNVVHFLETFMGRRSHIICLVTDYYEGGDLAQRIRQRHGQPFPEEQILDWFIHLTLGLQYLHDKGVVHRDLKSQNVFLTSQNVLKIGDFGICKELKRADGSEIYATTFVGTPYYIAPEVLLERPYSYESDLWAMGILLYEMMTLTFPFRATDLQVLLDKILTADYEPPSQKYSPFLHTMLARLLQRDPRTRIKPAEILAQPEVKHRMQRWSRRTTDPYVAALFRRRLLAPVSQAVIKAERLELERLRKEKEARAKYEKRYGMTIPVKLLDRSGSTIDEALSSQVFKPGSFRLGHTAHVGFTSFRAGSNSSFSGIVNQVQSLSKLQQIADNTSFLSSPSPIPGKGPHVELSEAAQKASAMSCSQISVSSTAVSQSQQSSPAGYQQRRSLAPRHLPPLSKVPPNASPTA